MAIALTATPAAAADDQTGVDEIADIISRAAPTAERVAPMTSSSRTEVRFDRGATEVSVSLDARRPVELTGDGPDVSISLPEGLDVKDGVVADDGTVVFEAAGDDAHAAVQTLDDGSVRLQTVLDSPDAPTTYTYDFGDDVELVLLEDGSVEVTEDLADGVTAVLGTIDAPWAIDAEGAEVPTHYTVDGSELIQHVDHGAQHAYPIAADPKVTHAWWNTTVYFSRNETALLAGGAGGAAAVASLIPDPSISKAVAILAGVSAAYIGTVHGAGGCIKAVFYGHVTYPTWQPYWGNEAGRYCR